MAKIEIGEWLRAHNIYSKSFYKKGNKSLKRWLAIFFTSFLSMLIIGVSTLFLGLHIVGFNNLDRGNISATDVDVPETAVDVYGDKDIINIMLYGIDSRDMKEQSRSDSIILLTIDKKHTKIKMTSIARDTRVPIEGFGEDKLNHAFVFGWNKTGNIAGGAALSLKTINNSFNLNVTDYVTANFWALATIIDYLGGVEIEVTKDEIDYINYQMYKNGQSKGNRATITAKPGLIKLNGQEALWYSRNRGLTIGEDGNEIGISGDDWDRTARQRKLLTKMVTDLKGAGLSEIVEIVNKIGPKITTNLKKDEIMGLVTNALTYIDYEVVQNYVPSEKLWYYNNPGEESYEVVGSCILVTDMEAQRKELAQFIYEDLVQ